MIEHELVKQNAEEAPCQEDGCTEMGFPCYLPDNSRDEPDSYYCSTHAFDAGFCKMCGDFWGGVESFEFIQNGYCDNCFQELERMNEDDDEECDYDYYDPAADY